MPRRPLALLLLAGLAACGDGQPLFDEEGDGVAATDTDGDGVPDAEDADDDSDGIPDEAEPDADGDGLIDDRDTDDDNDGVLDGSEPQAGEGADSDGDGQPDSVDRDDDSDGVPDAAEPDADGDGLIDDRDVDDDNDAVPDALEPDADEDGIPNDTDPDDDNDGTPDADEGGGGIGGDPALPPGTPSPSADAGIFRREADDGQGGGFVEDVAYDRDTDTFTVDNLAFDGTNLYTRDDAVGTLSTGGAARYAVYEAAPVARDQDGDPIGQLAYRAIYGVSGTTTADGEPTSRFAIVRTGSYVDYGFGGFVYERNGGVELPTTGQASYAGEYAGVRVFDGRGGLEYTRGDMVVDVDFEDFNGGAGVSGVVSGRQAFDIDGDPIPLGGEGQLVLPDLTFEIGPGVLTDDGELSAGLGSTREDEGGALQPYEEGTYYAIIGGEDAGEIVGVFVVESQDPRFTGVTAQETGGFILYR